MSYNQRLEAAFAAFERTLDGYYRKHLREEAYAAIMEELADAMEAAGPDVETADPTGLVWVPVDEGEEPMPTTIIVSRHPAAVQFIRESAGLPETVPVLATASEEDVKDKVVYGNLPFHLAALAREVIAVEFTGPPPRGAEYSVADMVAAGARLRRYTVQSLDDRRGAC